MMQALCLAKKHRAGLARVVTDGDDVIEFPPLKFIHMLGALAVNIDVQLPHHRNGFRAHEAWPYAGAFHVEPVARIVAQQSLRHLASSRIAGTQDQNSLLFHCYIASSARDRYCIKTDQ